MAQWASEAKIVLNDYLVHLERIALAHSSDPDKWIGNIQAYVKNYIESQADGVVTRTDVEEAIAQLGSPEQLAALHGIPGAAKPVPDPLNTTFPASSLGHLLNHPGSKTFLGGMLAGFLLNGIFRKVNQTVTVLVLLVLAVVAALGFAGYRLINETQGMPFFNQAQPTPVVTTDIATINVTESPGVVEVSAPVPSEPSLSSEKETVPAEKMNPVQTVDGNKSLIRINEKASQNIPLRAPLELGDGLSWRIMNPNDFPGYFSVSPETGPNTTFIYNARQGFLRNCTASVVAYAGVNELARFEVQVRLATSILQGDTATLVQYGSAIPMLRLDPISEEGVQLSWTLADKPAYGAVTFNSGPGTAIRAIYTPESNPPLRDRFSVKLTDSLGDSDTINVYVKPTSSLLSPAIIEPMTVSEIHLDSLDLPAGDTAYRIIRVDTGGNIYVCDGKANKIFKFAPNGEKLAEFGGQGSVEGQFNLPVDFVIDNDGYLYVVDAGNHCVQKIAQNKSLMFCWGERRYDVFDSPHTIAIDDAGYVYVSDNNQIQKFNAQGKVVLAWTVASLKRKAQSLATCMVFDPKGFIYLVEGNSIIHKYSLTGDFLASWGTEGKGAGQFDVVTGIAVDSKGYVYVGDANGHRIQKFSPQGEYISEILCFLETSNQTVTPQKLSLDSNDNLYVIGYLSDHDKSRQLFLKYTPVEKS